MLQPYIESATALSDYDEEIAIMSLFCRLAEIVTTLLRECGSTL